METKKMNLNLSIEVNEEMFSNMCQNTLENLPEEKLQEILLKAIEIALIEDKTNSTKWSKDILVGENYYPTAFTKKLLAQANFEKYFEPIGEEISNFIIKNYREIIIDAIASAFVNMLFTTNNKYNFEYQLIETIKHRYKLYET